MHATLRDEERARAQQQREEQEERHALLQAYTTQTGPVTRTGKAPGVPRYADAPCDAPPEGPPPAEGPPPPEANAVPPPKVRGAPQAPRDPRVGLRRSAGYRPPVLLVGEGNFSFCAALARRLGCGQGLVATTVDPETPADSEAEAKGPVALCRSQGCEILYDVDATQLLRSCSRCAESETLIPREVLEWPYTRRKPPPPP